MNSLRTVLGILPLLSAAICQAASAVGNLTPDAALHELQAGNARFVRGKLGGCSNVIQHRQELVQGQTPDAIVLSCSDSRVPTEQVFDQGPGKIFTVRDAGNVLSSEVTASIEYAVSHLGSRLIVIMGHEDCGAVKAALTTPKGQDAGSPSLNQLITDIRENLGPNATFDPAQDKKVLVPVKANVSAVADSLVKSSPIIRKAVESGQVRISRAVYSLESGQVMFWN